MKHEGDQNDNLHIDWFWSDRVGNHDWSDLSYQLSVDDDRENSTVAVLLD